jgi:putative hydrolase of the HAD superfamily
MPVVRRVLAVVLACTLLAACRVDADVDVAVADDGSGTVAVVAAFDADAVARVPDLEGALRTDDLTAAGWTVAAPETGDNGSVVVQAQKPFAAPEQLPAVLSEVSPAFTNVQLQRDRSFGEVTWTFDADVDFSGSAEQFGDDQLATLLGGRPLGRDIATLEQEIGTSIADATGLTLQVTLPGGATQEWGFRLGDPATAVHLDSTIERSGARVWAAVALGSAALLVLLLAVLTLRWGRRRRRGPQGPGVMDVDVASEDDLADGQRRLQLLVCAAHGVLWESHAASEEWLLSLVAMQGGTPDRDGVRALRREVELGRLTTAELWRALGLPADPRELDAAYAARFTLDPRVVELVTTLARRGVGVGCVTNDAAEWSALLRERFGLGRFIRPWIVSAEVGATVPAAAPFEEVARRAGIPLANCLYLDHRIENLDAARRLGLTTVLLGTDSAAALAAGHGHIGDLGDLLARRAERASG